MSDYIRVRVIITPCSTAGLADWRCGECNKLLGKFDGRGQVKCPRCGYLNTAHVVTEAAIPDTPPPQSAE